MQTARDIIQVISIALAIYGLISQPGPNKQHCKHQHRDTMAFPIEYLAGPLMGYAMAGWNDQRQMEQQRRLQELQVQGQMQMGRFNQALALETWERTNYPAQRYQMEKAGLNPGLMYSKGGPGGTTQGGAPGQVSGGQAPQGGREMQEGMGLALQMKMQQAQIDNLEAQTEKTKADTNLAANVEPAYKKALTANVEANTGNTNADTLIKQFNGQLAEITANIGKETQSDQIDQIRTNALRATNALQSERYATDVDKATMMNRIDQINNASIEQALRINLAQSNIIKVGAETDNIKEATKKIAADIFNAIKVGGKEWREWEIKDRETFVKEQVLRLQQAGAWQANNQQAFDNLNSVFGQVTGFARSLVKPTVRGF